MPQKRVGRPPLDEPRNIRIDVRLTASELKVLDEYCARKGISRPQGLRDGMKYLSRRK